MKPNQLYHMSFKSHIEIKNQLLNRMLKEMNCSTSDRNRVTTVIITWILSEGCKKSVFKILSRSSLSSLLFILFVTSTSLIFQQYFSLFQWYSFKKIYCNCPIHASIHNVVMFLCYFCSFQSFSHLYFHRIHKNGSVCWILCI